MILFSNIIDIDERILDSPIPPELLHSSKVEKKIILKRFEQSEIDVVPALKIDSGMYMDFYFLFP